MNGIVVTIYLVSKLEFKLKNNVLDVIYEMVMKFKAKREPFVPSDRQGSPIEFIAPVLLSPWFKVRFSH